VTAKGVFVPKTQNSKNEKEGDSKDERRVQIASLNPKLPLGVPNKIENKTASEAETKIETQSKLSQSKRTKQSRPSRPAICKFCRRKPKRSSCRLRFRSSRG
jgi:hypothetical protein